VEVTYELKAEDFYQFGKENAPAQSNYQHTVVLLSITYLLFIFSDMIYAFLSGLLPDLNFRLLVINIFVRILLTFVLMTIVLVIYKVIAAKKIKSFTDKSQNGVLCEHKIILTGKELIEITDVNISRYSWKAIGGIKESENFVMFEVMGSFSYIIPKKYFDNGQHKKDFIEEFQTHKRKSLDSFNPSYFTMLDKKSDLE
jgi:YcxB-like protein